MNYLRKLKAERKTMADYSRNLKKEIKACGVAVSWSLRNLKEYSSEMEMMSLMQGDKAINKSIARSAHLAHAYIKGMPYLMVENSVKEGNEPDLESVAEFIREYGRPEMRNSSYFDTLYKVEQWVAS